jgi:glutamate N-acetyltransferase / amino-acid N-acetyltransferase
MAKGSGMIHPNMATMIGVITTDCAISSGSLNKALRHAVNRSFNRISVDGDTSVCDMVVILANGRAGNTLITENDDHEYNRFTKALEMICIDLAKEIAADGEGATKLIEINVTGAPSDQDANKITRSICNSPLVKTAFFGEDANWGRILTAAGYSGAVFDPDKCSINIGSIPVFSSGIAVDFDEDHVKSILNMDEIKVNIDLSQGNGSDTMWTCDFSYDYIKINGSYRT